ncbi:PAS domain-containing protein [Flavobacterium undicola]|uniref:PAS domain-containing protein n=1 Tax=Flavobacterium undicola TaxID=1932779 RepID=UPI0013772A7C|nr:PAS domain S-box protein [Flavobacterium undicola]MBA0885426.1 PAS domain S-box protein [Flavobacterium undicola]
MNISFEKKIFLGFIINVVIVIAAAWIFLARINSERDIAMDVKLEIIEIGLFTLSILLLIVVYFIIKTQLKAKEAAQKLLEENKQLLQSIIDNTSSPISIKKLNGEYLLINQNFGELFGTTNERIIGKTDLDFLPREIAESYRSSDLEVAKKLIEIKSEETIQQKDGPHTYIAVKFPLYDATGRIYAIGGISTDITERKKLEDSLKATDAFFNMSFDIFTVAKNDHFIKINAAFTNTLGYTQKDMDEIKFMDLTHPDDRTTSDQVLTEILKGKTVISFKNRVRHKDGTYRWLDWNSNIDLKEGIIYSAARDITETVELGLEQQKAVDELYENEEKLRVIVENIGEGVIVANADKKVILANYMANDIFGIEEDDKISMDLTTHFELYFPDEKTIFPAQNLPMERAFNGEVTDDVDVVLWDPTSREKRRVLISGRPLIDQDNNIVAAVITIKDISKYKKMEEELEETETKYRKLIGFKNEAKEDKIEDKDKKKPL